MLGTCVRLTFGSYLIKLCKWDQNITLQLRFEVKSGLSYKNCASITSESCVKLTLGN